MNLKTNFIKAISLGSHSGLSEGKKFALQVSVLDGYCSILAFIFYILHTHELNRMSLMWVHVVCLLMMFVGLWLIHKRRYDIARPVIHQFGLYAIFASADAFGSNAGFVYYYFVSIMMPHLTYSLEEFWKAVPLSLSACLLVILQQFYGGGHFFGPYPEPEGERALAILIVVMFTLIILAVARWRLFSAQKEIFKQQSHLIHRSNLIALGEMAAGLSHEINNPLQTLSLQSQTLKESMQEINAPESMRDQLQTVDTTILRISRLVRSLSDLSRDVSEDPIGYFTLKEVMDEVLTLSSERLKKKGIKLEILGDHNTGIKGHQVQISQVLINVLNNSVDALQTVDEKWIQIKVEEIREKILISVIDSGPGVSEAIINKIMLPFFTTKDPGKGTGLGLSISKSILERNGGNIYYKQDSRHTCFVIELQALPDIT